MDIYHAAGVDYDTLDTVKRILLTEASATGSMLAVHSGAAVEESRGEPAFVFDVLDTKLALVVEGLGTKSVLAREYEETVGERLYDVIAFDTVAAIVNDLICVGALPLVLNGYFATGDAGWYKATDRLEQLAKGWRDACFAAEVTWGGGESPTLPGLVAAADIELGGSAVGHIPKGRDAILGEELAPGDAIVLVASSGLHANGASIARRLASRLENGLATKMPSGMTFGRGLLTPSLIYVRFVRTLLEQKLPITYLSHITGHGMRKLMRAARDLTYRLEVLPPVPEVLSFIVKSMNMSDAQAYGTFNMGAGFAVYCRAEGAQNVIAIAQQHGMSAIDAGRLEKGRRCVILEPLSCTFEADSLRLR